MGLVVDKEIMFYKMSITGLENFSQKYTFY